MASSEADAGRGVLSPSTEHIEDYGRYIAAVLGAQMNGWNLSKVSTKYLYRMKDRPNNFNRDGHIFYDTEVARKAESELAERILLGEADES